MGNDIIEYDESDNFGSAESRANSREFISGGSEKSNAPPVEIPRELLSEEAVEALIESFILREGTDYGHIETAHETKLKQIRKQLENGHIKIVFDPDSESATLLKKEDWERLTK
jgi:uncharacterized protein